MLESILSPELESLLRTVAGFVGAGAALLYFSLIFWTARDMAARSRESLLRAGAVLLVAGLNVVGFVAYLLLRPRETIAERYEREMIEELLARELSSGALSRRSQPAVPAIGAAPSAGTPPSSAPGQ